MIRIGPTISAIKANILPANAPTITRPTYTNEIRTHLVIEVSFVPRSPWSKQKIRAEAMIGLQSFGVSFPLSVLARKMPSRYGTAQSERILSKVGGGNPPMADASHMGDEAGFHSAQATSLGLKRVMPNWLQSSAVTLTISMSSTNMTDLADDEPARFFRAGFRDKSHGTVNLRDKASTNPCMGWWWRNCFGLRVSDLWVFPISDYSLSGWVGGIIENQL